MRRCRELKTASTRACGCLCLSRMLWIATWCWCLVLLLVLLGEGRAHNDIPHPQTRGPGLRIGSRCSLASHLAIHRRAALVPARRTASVRKMRPGSPTWATHHRGGRAGCYSSGEDEGAELMSEAWLYVVLLLLAAWAIAVLGYVGARRVERQRKYRRHVPPRRGGNITRRPRRSRWKRSRWRRMLATLRRAALRKRFLDGKLARRVARGQK